MRRLGPATAPARRHVALDGVAHAARNSHQTSPHLPGPRAGRAARDNRERHLAKGCVGSDRVLTRTIATSRSEATTTETDGQEATTRAAQDSPRPTKQRKTDLRPALRLRANPEKTVSPLTYSFRNGTPRRSYLERDGEAR